MKILKILKSYPTFIYNIRDDYKDLTNNIYILNVEYLIYLYQKLTSI